MRRRNSFLGAMLISVLEISFLLSCSSTQRQNANGRTKKIAINCPVYLSLTGIVKDSNILAYFTDAFTQKAVRLITQDEMEQAMNLEFSRVRQKLELRKSEIKGKGAAVFQKAYQDELRTVVNMLSVNLFIHDRDENSRMIYKASWSNIAMPINSRNPVPRKREIDLKNHSLIIRDNVFAIVDSIVYSRELY